MNWWITASGALAAIGAAGHALRLAQWLLFAGVAVLAALGLALPA